MKRRAVDNYTGPTTLGIDVSRYQGEIDWAQVVLDDDRIRFALIRTGDGSGEDRNFVENVRGARAVGLRLGSYHYFRVDRGGDVQARIVRDLWDEAGGFRPGFDIPPALDLESGSRKNLPRGVWEGPSGEIPLDVVARESLEHLDELGRAFGVRALIYSGVALHWWFSQGVDRELAERFSFNPLWLPSYSSKPLMPVDARGRPFPHKQWSIWQYTAHGQVDGIERAGVHLDVDMNRFRGDETTLDAFCSISQVC